MSISFKQETANMLRQQAETASVLVNNLGYSSDVAIDAVTSGDLRILLGEKPA